MSKWLYAFHARYGNTRQTSQWVRATRAKVSAAAGHSRSRRTPSPDRGERARARCDADGCARYRIKKSIAYEFVLWFKSKKIKRGKTRIERRNRLCNRFSRKWGTDEERPDGLKFLSSGGARKSLKRGTLPQKLSHACRSSPYFSTIWRFVTKRPAPARLVWLSKIRECGNECLS